MDSVKQITSDQLSTFRTSHVFEHYAEFTTVDEFRELAAWARQNKLPVFILGNGSNTLFTRGRIKSLVLRNRMPREMKLLDEHRIEVSSSLLITTVLKHCEKNGLDSCYYLASVPATLGGALAMNAGRGRDHHMTIYDFVESVTYFAEGHIHTLTRDQIELDYRHTMFTGLHDKLILSAVLRFEPLENAVGKIRERIDWSKEVQDHSAPNCGSVFCEAHYGILRRLRGVRLGKSRYSSKVSNWLLTNSRNTRSLRWLIWLAKVLHRLIGRRAKLELIEVD